MTQYDPAAGSTRSGHARYGFGPYNVRAAQTGPYTRIVQYGAQSEAAWKLDSRPAATGTRRRHPYYGYLLRTVRLFASSSSSHSHRENFELSTPSAISSIVSRTAAALTVTWRMSSNSGGVKRMAIKPAILVLYRR